MNNNGPIEFVSNLKAVQKEIGILETKYHNANVDILKRRLNSKKLRNNLTKKINMNTKTRKDLQNKVNACRNEEAAIQQRVDDLTASLSSLKAAESSFNSNVQVINANLARMKQEMNAKKKEIMNIKAILEGPTPPGPGNNGRRLENNLPSTPSFGTGPGATKIATAANAALAQKRANNKKAAFSQLMQFNREKKKNLTKINTTGGKVKKAALAIEAIEAMKKKRNTASQPVQVERVNHSSTVAQKKANARASLSARLKERSFANVARTKSSDQPVSSKNTSYTNPSFQPVSAINQARKQAGPSTMVAPMRPTKKITGQSAANQIIQAGINGAKRMRSNSARSLTQEQQKATNLIFAQGQQNPHARLMKQASGITGSALQMPGYTGKQTSSQSETGAGKRVVQQAWESPRKSTLANPTAASIAKQQFRPPSAGQPIKAGSGTGGGNKGSYWAGRRSGSASQPSTPRPSSSRSSGRPASAPSTPSGGRGEIRNASGSRVRSQIGFKRW